MLYKEILVVNLNNFWVRFSCKNLMYIRYVVRRCELLIEGIGY